MSRPVPVPDETSAEFWEAAERGELVLAKCSRCEQFAHPPAPVCPHCHHSDPRFAFVPVAGIGEVKSWTVMHQAFLPGFEVPFVLADVAIDGVGDVRLIGRLVSGEPSLGARVQVVFDDGVPAFELA